MASSTRTNMAVVDLFSQGLDTYESTLPLNAMEPSTFIDPGSHLEVALNRLLIADPADGYQMMRILTKRMLKGMSEHYSEFMILMVATSSPSPKFKGDMVNIVHMLYRTLNNNSTPLDDVWFNAINRNDAIRNFIKNYDTSDICRIHNAYQGNVVGDRVVSACSSTTDAQHVTVRLGVQNTTLMTISPTPVTVKFSPDEKIAMHSSYRNTLPKVIVSKVTISPMARSFILDKSIRLTEGAVLQAVDIDCLDIPYTVGSGVRINLPGQFNMCELDVASFDSGLTWVVGNLKILPPSYT